MNVRLTRDASMVTVMVRRGIASAIPIGVGSCVTKVSSHVSSVA